MHCALLPCKWLMWYERDYSPFSSFRVGRTHTTLTALGAQLLLTPFCCAKQNSITTWEPREAPGLPCSCSWTSVITGSLCFMLPVYPRSHLLHQLPLLPATMFLLLATTYLLFTVIVTRPQEFCFPTEVC